MSTNTVTRTLTDPDPTYEISPTIVIDASPDAVWEYLIDVEAWWVDSSPEHDSLELLAGDDAGLLAEGTELRVRESVADIPGVAQGVITEFAPGDRVTWEVPRARYRLFGVPLEVEEGVTWMVAASDRGTQLTAYVWATFPDTALGRLATWTFRHLLNGVERDIEHARTELEYIKRAVEGRQP